MGRPVTYRISQHAEVAFKLRCHRCRGRRRTVFATNAWSSPPLSFSSTSRKRAVTSGQNDGSCDGARRKEAPASQPRAGDHQVRSRASCGEIIMAPSLCVLCCGHYEASDGGGAQ